MSEERLDPERYVGTLVGESTSREFRLAVAHETVREQDIIAVDARPRSPEGAGGALRVWAKVQRLERLNPLFPTEAGHELAATRTDPLDTVLSLSREMVTAVCQVLGAEPLEGAAHGKLDHLRYPPQPATSAYRPSSQDIQRVVLGELQQRRDRALDLAVLSNRPEVDVKVDGHAIVTRHLAILAMTGAGKSWTARRLIEQLALKDYPIVIFDPHGDYTGLAEVPALKDRVSRYYAKLPIFEQPPEVVATIVEGLGWPLANTHRNLFEDLFSGAQALIRVGAGPNEERALWFSQYLKRPTLAQYGLKPDLYCLADLAQAVVLAGLNQDTEAQSRLLRWTERSALKVTKQVAGYLEGLPRNLGTAAKRLRQMETISRQAARTANPLPTDRKDLVQYGRISVVSLAGYQGDFQATLYSIIADELFAARVTGDLKLPALLVLEEAHNFAPARAATPAEERAILMTRQIAQEGRKFGLGMVIISQRPSRLDATTLSQCNSFVVMRMVNPADQQFVRNVIETLGEEDARMLPDLDVGEALLSGQLINFPVLVRVKAPASQGEREEEDAFEALKKARQGPPPQARTA